MSRQNCDAIDLKRFTVYVSDTDGLLWIERSDGDRAGEGMEVKMDEFEAMVEAFYEQRF
jgi:hypothetical protein